MIEKGMRLEIEFSLTDPKNWVGTWKITKHWRRVDDRDIAEVECLPDLNEHMPSREIRMSTFVSAHHATGGRAMRRLQVAGSLVIALCMAGSAWAHHTAAGIDQTKTVTVEGTVKQFKWANPHSWMEIEVPDGKGGVALWNVEMTAPAGLVRAGWKNTTVKPGDKVKMTLGPWSTARRAGSSFPSRFRPDRN